MSEKTNCYTCIHRGQVVGSAHSCCKHEMFQIPELKKIMIMQLLQGRLNVNPSCIVLTDTETDEKQPLQDFNPHGIRNGWVIFPMNFDPVWLNKCWLHEENPT